MEELIVKLLINGVGIANDVHPVFGDDIKINLDREENQIFRREKIEGTFQFFGADFELIYGCSIYTTFTLQIYRGNALVGSADFIRTDCEFNLDDGICQVKLTTKDIYEKFLNSYENKYNLVGYGAVGEPFDPDIHEAIGKADEDVAEPTLKAVYLKGCKLKERVIRHAKVMVSMPKEGN